MADWDTAAKRFSGMGLGDFGPCLLPIPDATLDQPDRQHLLDCYSAIVFATFTAPTAGTSSGFEVGGFAQSAFAQSAFRGGVFGSPR